MARRIAFLLLTVLGTGTLSGCLVGPPRPMVIGEWRDRIQRPIVLNRDFAYHGEFFEEAYYPDEIDDADTE